MIESFNEEEFEGKIDQYINGQLSSSEIDELWLELVQDKYKLDYLKSAANLKAVVKKRQQKQKIKRIRTKWSYAAAAVITLFIAVTVVMNVALQDGTASVEPVTSVEMNYYRSGDGFIAENDEPKIIRNAITLANTGKLNQALSLLKEELRKTTNIGFSAKLSLNIASLHYNEGQYQQAVSYYNNIISNKRSVDMLMLEKAYWYAGNAYFHMGQLDAAQSNIKKAYELNGAYRRVADSYLDALKNK